MCSILQGRTSVVVHEGNKVSDIPTLHATCSTPVPGIRKQSFTCPVEHRPWPSHLPLNRRLPVASGPTVTATLPTLFPFSGETHRPFHPTVGTGMVPTAVAVIGCNTARGRLQRWKRLRPASPPSQMSSVWAVCNFQDVHSHHRRPRTTSAGSDRVRSLSDESRDPLGWPINAFQYCRTRDF